MEVTTPVREWTEEEWDISDVDFIPMAEVIELDDFRGGNPPSEIFISTGENKKVVINCECNPVQILGFFLYTEEESVFYEDQMGMIFSAPEDCVIVFPYDELILFLGVKEK